MAEPKTLKKNKPIGTFTANDGTNRIAPASTVQGPYPTFTGPPPTPQTGRPASAIGDDTGGNSVGQLARNTSATGVPQSFVDGLSNYIDSGQGTDKSTQDITFNGKNLGKAPRSNDQEHFDSFVNTAWNSLSYEQRQEYIAGDEQRTAAANRSALEAYTQQQALSLPQQQAAAANKYQTEVTDPARQKMIDAQEAQRVGNRALESENQGYIRDYGQTLDQNEALRMAGIERTNSKINADADAFYAETQAANQRNNDIVQRNNTLIGNANARSNQLFDTYANQMAGYNANQTGLFNTFQGQAASANAQQNANLAQLGGAVSGANSQQNALLATYQSQLASMNAEDRAAYSRYLQETNPLMAELIAQNSNPEYVKNMEDVVSRYRDLATPQVTDQERFLAELARRKFESDDQGNREALQEQLATRGLKSGGLVIAGQQAKQQQLSQDRMLNELGLNAQAVSRGMQGLAGYSDASTALRNADDAMRQFQDVYKQNEYVRRGNLAQQRNQQSLATTGQITARDTAGYNAGSQTVRDNYGRNLDYYNAGTETVNNNFSRDQSVFDAGTTTNRDNSMRDTGVFNAGRETNDTTFGRSQGGLGSEFTVNQTNLGNSQNAFNTRSGPNGSLERTDNRYQEGLNSGNLAAGSKLTANQGGIAFRSGNLAGEAGTASNTFGQVSGAGVQQAMTGSQSARDQLAALGTVLVGLQDEEEIKKKQAMG